MPRPLEVTLVADLTLIAAAFGVFLGGFALVGGWDVAPGWLPWATLGYGLLCLAAALGLLRGSAAARVVATAVFALGLAQSVLVVVQAPAQAASVVVVVLVTVIAALLLYTPRANAFFRRRPSL